MTPKTTDTPITEDLFRHQLTHIIDTEHELCQLADHMDWKRFEGAFGGLYSANQGRSGIPIRLMVGLHYLKEVYGLSDEAVVARWVENPYWQYFCGEHYFQHQLPMDASSLTRFRRKIGEAGCEWMLSATVQVGVATETVKRGSLERVTVDTTVQEKAVSFPTDSKLYNRSRERLVKLARHHGVVLRQNYNRKAPRALRQPNRYGHITVTRYYLPKHPSAGFALPRLLGRPRGPGRSRHFICSYNHTSSPSLINGRPTVWAIPGTVILGSLAMAG